MKKRYFLYAWIAVELMALPAAASVVQRVEFKVGPIVAAAELPDQGPGVTRYLVSSNAPFSVKISDMIGQVDLDVIVSGEMGTETFGAAAQLPGAATRCSLLTSPAPQIVYRATEKTAAERGTPVEQAVMFEFRHDAAANPTVEFTTEPVGLLAGQCGTAEA